MDQKLAVLFMPDDMTLTKEKTPLMLRPILFCPILTWMIDELMGQGIERFFIVSDKRAHDMMRPYVPENADVVYVDGARHGEELLTLLKDEKGSVLIVNGAALPVGVLSCLGAMRARRRARPRPHWPTNGRLPSAVPLT